MKRILPLAAVVVLGAFAGRTDKIGSPAPAFNGTTLTGDQLDLADYKGRVVLLDFWASWCGPCRDEMPFLVDLQKKYGEQGLAVIAVNIDDEVANARAFLGNLHRKPSFPIVVDAEKHLPSLYDIEAMPTSVYIDKKGIVRYWHNGYKNSQQQQYRDELKVLLDEE